MPDSTLGFAILASAELNLSLVLEDLKLCTREREANIPIISNKNSLNFLYTICGRDSLRYHTRYPFYW